MAFLGGNSLFSFHHTIGNKQMTAISHLKLVNVIGEAWPTKNFPTTKFPPHKQLVNNRRKK
ncbi:hypothetical protein J19TS1_38520 [Heyndrickxia oleronia]|nr:hypothetical protein J19TS1_38520 [Heyndrickxia oleronia]